MLFKLTVGQSTILTCSRYFLRTLLASCILPIWAALHSKSTLAASCGLACVKLALLCVGSAPVAWVALPLSLAFFRVGLAPAAPHGSACWPCIFIVSFCESTDVVTCIALNLITARMPPDIGCALKVITGVQSTWLYFIHVFGSAFSRCTSRGSVLCWGLATFVRGLGVWCAPGAAKPWPRLAVASSSGLRKHGHCC